MPSDKATRWARGVMTDQANHHCSLDDLAASFDTFAEEACAQVREEIDDLQRTFDLRWDADMRAVARWRAEDPHGRGLTLPDRADLVVWLLRQADESDETVVGRVAAAMQNLEVTNNAHMHHGDYDKQPTAWFVVDTSTAEPDVNWPGELVEECDSPEAARLALARAVLMAVPVPARGTIIDNARHWLSRIDPADPDFRQLLTERGIVLPEK